MPDPIKDILRFVIILKWGQALSFESSGRKPGGSSEMVDRNENGVAAGRTSR